MNIKHFAEMQGAFLMLKKEGGKMIRVNSTVTINQVAISRLTSLAKAALEQTAEALHTEVVQAQVVPRDTGNLQGEAMSIDKSRSSNGKVSIVHSAPYARRLYYHPEYNFHREDWVDREGNSHGSNPNAKGLWLEDWCENGTNQNFCAETFKRIYSQLIRGI